MKADANWPALLSASAKIPNAKAETERQAFCFLLHRLPPRLRRLLLVFLVFFRFISLLLFFAIDIAAAACLVAPQVAAAAPCGHGYEYETRKGMGQQAVGSGGSRRREGAGTYRGTGA